MTTTVTKAAELAKLIDACDAAAILYASMGVIEARSGFLSDDVSRHLDDVVAAERRAAALRAVAARLG